MLLKATNTEEVPGVSNDAGVFRVPGIGYVEIQLSPSTGLVEALTALEKDTDDANVMNVITAFIDYQIPEKLAKKLRRLSASVIANLFEQWMSAFQKSNSVSLGESSPSDESSHNMRVQ